jgi:hypothetical protein
MDEGQRGGFNSGYNQEDDDREEYETRAEMNYGAENMNDEEYDGNYEDGDEGEYDYTDSDSPNVSGRERSRR